MRGQDPPEVHKTTPAQEIRRQKHEKQNDNRSLSDEYGPGGRQRRLRSRQNRILHQYRRTGTERDSCKALRCADGAGLRDALQEKPDLENICKENFDFASVCQIKTDCKDQNTNQDQNAGNTQNKSDQANKNDKENKDDRDDSSKDEPVSAGQSSMTSQVVSLVNSERAAQGIAALQNDSKLSEIAQQKAEDMAKNQFFSHTSPTYGSAFDMLKAAGYSYKTAGENIAMGQKSAASVMDGWMHSSGHRANILHTSYEKIGVGYAVSADGTPYWVQIFAG